MDTDCIYVSYAKQFNNHPSPLQLHVTGGYYCVSLMVTAKSSAIFTEM